MSRFTALLRDQRAAAAAEMALVIPLLLVIMLGSFEIGNFFLDEHALVKGVRDGAVYAAHQDISNYNCSSPGTAGGTVQADTKNVVRSGQLSGGTDRLPNWSSSTFTVTFTCVTQASDGTNLSGMYVINSNKVPIVTVTASLPYHSVLSNLGFRPATLTLNASQQATVMGI